MLSYEWVRSCIWFYYNSYYFDFKLLVIEICILYVYIINEVYLSLLLLFFLILIYFYGRSYCIVIGIKEMVWLKGR